MSDVEQVVSAIGWIQIGTTDDSNKINRAIDMLRAQARRVAELEGERNPTCVQCCDDGKSTELCDKCKIAELQAQLDTWVEVTCHSSVDGLRDEMHRNQLLLEDVSGQLRISDNKAIELQAQLDRAKANVMELELRKLDDAHKPYCGSGFLGNPPRLSDGMIASLREDVASSLDGRTVVYEDAYIAKALDEVEWLREELDRAKEANDSLALKMGMLVEELASATCGEEWDPAKYVATKTPEEIRAAGYKWADERATVRELRERLDRATSEASDLRDRLSVRSMRSVTGHENSPVNREAQRHWLIFFEDTDAPDELYTDEATAREAYGQRVDNWTCHLFEQVTYNGAQIDRKPAEPRPVDDAAFREVVIAQAGNLMECACSGDAFELDVIIDAIVDARPSQEPRPMSEAPRVWSGPETHIAMDVWKFGWTPKGHRWMGAHHRLSTGMIFVPMQYSMPSRDPSELNTLRTCSEVDWLPTTTAPGGSGGEP